MNPNHNHNSNPNFEVKSVQERGENPFLTRHAVGTLKMAKGEYAPYMHSFAMLHIDKNTSTSSQSKNQDQGNYMYGTPHPPPPPPPTHAVLIEHSMHIAFAKLVAGFGKTSITSGFDINRSRPNPNYNP